MFEKAKSKEFFQSDQRHCIVNFRYMDWNYAGDRWPRQKDSAWFKIQPFQYEQ